MHFLGTRLQPERGPTAETGCMPAGREGTPIYIVAQSLITMDPQEMYACAMAPGAGHLDIAKWCSCCAFQQSSKVLGNFAEEAP